MFEQPVAIERLWVERGPKIDSFPDLENSDATILSRERVEKMEGSASPYARRLRGLDPDKILEEIATLETARRRIIPEIEGLKRQQNASGDDFDLDVREVLRGSNCREEYCGDSDSLHQYSFNPS